MRELFQRRKVTIILYHDPSPDTAERHISILQRKYNFISLKDYVEARKNEHTHKLPDKSLILTFDDGHKNNYRMLHLFEKYRIPVTIFICSQIVGTKRHFWFKHPRIDETTRQSLKKVSDDERLEILSSVNFNERAEFDDVHALSRTEVESMKTSVDFQSHTRFHPILTQCSEERAFEEIAQSKKELELTYNLTIYALSYPNGDYSEREISIAQEAGYECGITLDPGFNSKHSDLFRLKRICVTDTGDLSELLVKASGLWAYLRRIAKFVHQSKTDRNHRRDWR